MILAGDSPEDKVLFERSIVIGVKRSILVLLDLFCLVKFIYLVAVFLLSVKS